MCRCCVLCDVLVFWCSAVLLSPYWLAPRGLTNVRLHDARMQPDREDPRGCLGEWSRQAAATHVLRFPSDHSLFGFCLCVCFLGLVFDDMPCCLLMYAVLNELLTTNVFSPSLQATCATSATSSRGRCSA